MRQKVLSKEEAAGRLIRRSDMVACKLAFIDCKLPGSELKENYSLIGPGVTQSKDQVVNLVEEHGFSVGAAAMPSGSVNNLHVHFTAEVFMIHHGRWRFRWGSDTGIQEVDAGPGDILSIPTWIFRGFSNVGEGDGWIFTLLGGDDTGGIIWHPAVLEAAATHGMYLTRDNMLVDTQAGDPMPAPEDLLVPLDQEQMRSLYRYTPEEMGLRVLRSTQRSWSASALLGSIRSAGCELAPVIGHGLSEDRNHACQISNPHGFSVEWLRINPGASSGRFLLREKLVIFVMKGAIELILNEPESAIQIALGEQELYSVPADVWREIRAVGDEPAEIILTVSGDHRKRIVWPQELVQEAQAAGYVLDPNGYIAKKDMLPDTALNVGVCR
jgi:mannose-6-phosphate isomerase-like protein (cupin superfamily)